MNHQTKLLKPLRALCAQVGAALAGTTRLSELCRLSTVSVRCRACGHRGETPVRRLIRDHGRDMPLSRVPFTCSRCGSTDVEVG